MSGARLARFSRLFLRNQGAVFGLAALSFVLFLAAFSWAIFPTDPWQMVGRPFSPPLTNGFLLGSDALGRDIAAGLAHGARVSLLVGLVATSVAVLIGLAVGVTSGYAGGAIDEFLMGLTEIFQTIPAFVLAIVAVSIIGPSLASIVLAIAVVSWPTVARLARAEVLSIKSRDFVSAAILAGHSHFYIATKEILPNVLAPIIAAATLMVASAVLLESALSFLGLGDPNLMTWGYLIGAGRNVIRHAWWIVTFPGLAIVISVLALNLVGEGIGDAMNPHLRRREK